jgi:putative ABC transport system ATP-binding protein
MLMSESSPPPDVPSFQVRPPLIEMRGVSKVYGEGPAAVHALADVDLTIEEGEFVAIMGPSGSGKSTAMNILGCLDTPTSGEYLFKGVPVGQLDSTRRTLLRRHFLGFVFQGFNLLPRTTARENVELPLIYRGASEAQRDVMVARAMARVGLEGREHHTPAALSGGQQQRVAIARAIVTEPMVLLADEPTGNLDSKMSREIMDLVSALNRDQRITVIMVTHETDIAAYARRTIRFVDGRVESDTGRRMAA